MVHRCDGLLSQSKMSRNIAYVFIVFTLSGSSLKIVSEIYPSVSFGLVVLVYFIGIVIVLIAIRNTLEYCVSSLIWYSWITTVSPILFLAIYNLGVGLGVNVASFILTVFSVVFGIVFGKFASRVTTSQETMLFLFPIHFGIDLTQAMFYLSSSVSVTSFQFWLLLSFQEIISVLFNTGLKSFLLHQLSVLTGRATCADNPFANQEQVALIVAKANLDTLSEHMSIFVVAIASCVGVLASYLGANVQCSWCNNDYPERVFPVLVIVVIVRAIVLVGEQKLLQYFVQELGKSVMPIFDAFYSSRIRSETSSLILLTILSICTMCQVLANTG